MEEYEESLNKFVYGTLDYMIKKGEEADKVHNMEDLKSKLLEFKEHALDVYKGDKEQCEFYTSIYNIAMQLTEKYSYKELKELSKSRLEEYSPFSE